MRGPSLSRASPPIVVDAVRHDGRTPRAGVVSYRVIEEARPERRRIPRRAVRLRRGKLIDTHGAYLSDCRIGDVAGKGLGLVLFEPVDLPASFRVYEEREGTISEARIAWRHAHALGVVLGSPTSRAFSRCAWLDASLYAL